MSSNSSLIQWLATFKLDGQNSVELNDDAYYNLADGYVSARILNQISPQYFSDKWLDGIKPVPPNGSWRLRVSNLKRILQKIHDYSSDLQNSQFKPNAITPDVAVIAQNFDPDQISRLIQLILFCAINCDKKQEYIEKIRTLPTQVKQDIKEAIEELLIKNNDGSYNQRLNTSHVGNESFKSDNDGDTTTSYSQRGFNTSSSHSAVLSPARSLSNSRGVLRRDSSQDISRNHDSSAQSNYDQTGETIDEIKQKLNTALAINEEKAQACHELERRLRELQLEKDQLAYENDRLSSNSTKLSSTPNKSFMSTSRQSQATRDNELASDSRNIENRLKNLEDEKSQNLMLQQNRKLQNEVQILKEKLIKVETEKEDYKLKSDLLKDDLDKITSKHDEICMKAEQAKRLQDELDEHKQISEKVSGYETMIENLVKKNNEIKRELKSLEDKNITHIQKIVRLEEDNKQLSNTISQVEIYKKQMHEAQVKLSQETHRADKIEVELSRLSEKYSAARKENEKLYETTNKLLEGVGGNNLQLDSRTRAFSSVNLENTSPSKTKFSNKNTFDGDFETQQGNDILNSMSTSVIELKERIARLEYENELLQNKLSLKKETDQSVLGGLLEGANSRCTKLEIENRQSRKKILMLESRLRDLMNSQNGASTSQVAFNDSSSDNVLALMNRVEQLQRQLFEKEQELMESEAKYKRSTQKAKEVIKTLKNNQPIGGSLHPSCMSSASSFNSSSLDETNLLKQQLKEREERLIEMEREFYEFRKFKEIHERLIISAFYGLTTPMQWKNADRRLGRTTLTSPPNTASSSINHSKHSH